MFLAMSMIGMAAAYSPNPAEPCGVEFPFDLHTGELRGEVWERWLEHDPVRLCERHVDGLKKLRFLFLDCGSRDQFHLQYGLRILRQRLERLEVTHTAEEFDDGHMDTAYRYDVSLPLLWKHICEGDV